MAISGEKHIVHWFRRGLRLHDNPSLKEGLQSATTFRCVFIIDPWFAGSSNVGINKWRFLLQCLEDLDRSLKKLNSRLFVIRGQPADTLPKLFKEWGTTSLSFEEDPEPFGRVRDHNIAAMCREIGINVISKVSHTLYKLDKIIEKNGGRAPLTYYQFQTIVASMEAPNFAEASITPSSIGNAITPINEDHDEKYGVPTLEELGFDTDGLVPPIWLGGESEALTRLERHLERKAWVASFGRPKMTPQSLLASKTGLSPYLRFGCLSTRLFYYQLTDLYKKIKKARPPLSLHGQLLWREFFYCAATKNPNFDKMVGNPICVQIPWTKNNDALSKWANGQTGYPWIDAIMIQLREEGWIHHLARHAVACFLTRGDLWLSWEEGMKVFEELLLDADWSVNAGMWMWLSCSSFFQQFFHCYCPVRFGRKADPYGDYIRKYIPSLRNYPTHYIHAPWTAPIEVQKSSGCVIGRDYPLPIVDHATASRVNIQRIKQVYRKLAKYKPLNTNDDSAKSSMIQSLMVDNLNRSNMPVSSPSPNSVISYINQSNYLYCSTPESQNNSDTYQQSTDKEDDNKQKFGKPMSDIFNENQYRNNLALQMCNMPFKKIVVIDQDYETIKDEDSVDNEDEKRYKRYNQLRNREINCSYDSNSSNSYVRQRKFFDERDEEYRNASCSKSHNDKNLNNEDPFYYSKYNMMKVPQSAKLNYCQDQCDDDDSNDHNYTVHRNYNYSQEMNSENFRQPINYMYNVESDYRDSIKQRKKREQISKLNIENHDCSLSEEHARFQQGRSVAMQGCNRPNS